MGCAYEKGTIIEGQLHSVSSKWDINLVHVDCFC